MFFAQWWVLDLTSETLFWKRERSARSSTNAGVVCAGVCVPSCPAHWPRHTVHNATSALFLRGCGLVGGDALHHGDKAPAACRPIRSGSAIRRAGTARVVTNIHSREMCDRAIISVVPTADSDVAIVRSSQVITVEDEGQLNSLLEQCATDADNRMTIAARAIEGKLTRPDASIYDLVVSCVEEAHACDLQPRHATRLALEAALSQASLHDPNATAATIKATAASIQNCSHLDGQGAITNILELLEREQLEGLALNVLSVLAFSGALQLEHLVSWRKNHMPDPNLGPLFAWVEAHATPPRHGWR